jgi:glycosyltransferase involved in cell wall biosynthesis
VDIIHGHGAKAGLYARIVGRLTGKKSVYTPHGGSAHDMFKWPMSWIYQTMERMLASITDYFIFESVYTSQAMAQRLGYQPSNAVVNSNGIENCTVEKNTLIQAQTKLVEIDPLTQCRFAVFGMLRPQKGQHIAIDALALLKEKGVKASLHLFGQGSSQADLAATSRVIRVEGVCVLFHGDVSPVEPWMQAVDVILIPSLFESFGYVAVEAMMLSCPLIVSKTGGLVDVM